MAGIRGCGRSNLLINLLRSWGEVDGEDGFNEGSCCECRPVISPVNRRAEELISGDLHTLAGRVKGYDWKPLAMGEHAPNSRSFI